MILDLEKLDRTARTEALEEAAKEARRLADEYTFPPPNIEWNYADHIAAANRQGLLKAEAAIRALASRATGG